MQDLEVRIKSDLEAIGIVVDFELVLKPYSKTYYGCFRPNTNRVYVYVFKDSSLTTMYPYDFIMETAIHEAIHAKQWHDENHVRIKGIMHDEEFYRLLDKFKKRYYEKSNDSLYSRSAEITGRNCNCIFKRGNVSANTNDPNLDTGSNYPVRLVAFRRHL